MKFQSGSVVNTRSFCCFLYTFSIDWGARIQSQGWMVLPDSASRRSHSQGNSLPNQDLTGFGFLNCLAVSNPFREDEGELGCFKEETEKEKHQRRMEGVEDKLYNSTILYLGLIPEAMDLTTMLHRPHKSFGFTEHSLCIRCDHGHPHV